MNFSKHTQNYSKPRKSDILLLRSKNNRIQQDHDQFIQRIQKQEKLIERRDLGYISKLNKNLKTFEDFKKLQFNTEYELRLAKIRSLDKIDCLDSTQYQKLCENLRNSLKSRFKLKDGLRNIESEKNTPRQSLFSLNLTETWSSSSICSPKYSQIKNSCPTITKNAEKNVILYNFILFFINFKFRVHISC